MADQFVTTEIIELATELTRAWLSNPNTRASAEDVPAFLHAMHSSVANLAVGSEPHREFEPAQEFLPAVSVRKSLASKDHIISMIDGKPYKMLKRHLAINGLTPGEYRERYGLKPDYPMVAENYAQLRRGLAQKIGLGQRGAETQSTSPADAAPKPADAVEIPAERTRLKARWARPEAKSAI